MIKAAAGEKRESFPGSLFAINDDVLAGHFYRYLVVKSGGADKHAPARFSTDKNAPARSSTGGVA